MARARLIKDAYREKRGGYARLLRLSCEKCAAYVCLYQKDGGGALRRLYIDRILESKVPLNKKELSCPNEHALGARTNYEKEDRPAFRLFVDAVVKKVVAMAQSPILPLTTSRLF